MDSKFILAILAITMLLASGCVSIVKYDDNTTDSDIATEIDDLEGLEEVSAEDAGLPTKTVMEGETVSFPNLKATDPDGDAITYTFSAPLDTKGMWKTAKGDAGKYVVVITASDGTTDVSQEVLVIVKSVNKAPVLETLEDLEISEGETVLLAPSATDGDGDDVEITFSGWMTSEKKTAGYADAGEHVVTITATDGKDSVSQEITINVANVNRAPKVSVDDVVVNAGELVSVTSEAEDADGDDVIVSFSTPLDENGKWQTGRSDAGKYMVKATASDGMLDSTVSFYVTVQSTNAAPVLEGIADLEVSEGDLIELEVTATDEEGDDVTISFGTPFNDDGTWQTGFGDAGKYVVTVTATDGTSEVEETFEVVVSDVNRAPVFAEGAFN